MRRPSSRPSTVDRLDPEIKRLITDLRIDQGWTIDEIRQKLMELGASISRSALGRHIRSIEEIGAELREKREIARVLTENVNAGDEGKLAQLNIELGHAAVMRLHTAATDGVSVVLDAKEAMFMSAATNNLVNAAAKLNDLRRKAKAEAQKEAAETVERVGKSSGLTRAVIDSIKHAVLGVEA